MVWKGILAIFESSGISKIGGAALIKIGVHAHDINPYLHEWNRKQLLLMLQSSKGFEIFFAKVTYFNIKTQ